MGEWQVSTKVTIVVEVAPRYVFSSQCGGKSTKIGCSAKKTAEDFALGWGDTEISDVSVTPVGSVFIHIFIGVSPVLRKMA